MPKVKIKEKVLLATNQKGDKINTHLPEDNNEARTQVIILNGDGKSVHFSIRALKHILNGNKKIKKQHNSIQLSELTEKLIGKIFELETEYNIDLIDPKSLGKKLNPKILASPGPIVPASKNGRSYLAHKLLFLSEILAGKIKKSQVNGKVDKALYEEFGSLTTRQKEKTFKELKSRLYTASL